MTRKDYISLINDWLVVKNEMRFREAVEHYNERVYPFPYERFEDIIYVCRRIKEKYGIDYSYKLDANYYQRVIWQRAILGRELEEEAKVSTEWVLFGCLIDTFLDSETFSNIFKDKLCMKLNGDIFFKNQPSPCTVLPEIDILTKDIYSYLTRESTKKSACYSYLSKSIERALASEKYISTGSLKIGKYKNDNLPLLVDKSVEFEKTAYMISIFPYLNKQCISLIINISEVFWLIDDLCDCFDDVKARRKNSLLFMFARDDEDIDTEERLFRVYKNIPQICERIEQNLDKVRVMVGEEYYYYLTVLIWRWGKEIREEFENDVNPSSVEV